MLPEKKRQKGSKKIRDKAAGALRWPFPSCTEVKNSSPNSEVKNSRPWRRWVNTSSYRTGWARDNALNQIWSGVRFESWPANGCRDGPPACSNLELIWNYGSYRLLRRGINLSHVRYLHRTSQTRKKLRRQCFEWDSNPRSQCLSGRKNFVTYRFIDL
jgi:hypothetical protein